MSVQKTAAHFPWQRLTVCLMGCGMVWFFLQTHRSWVWAYFESLMLIDKPSAELAQVATQSINAITTIAISGISAISAIVLFFVTGNVAALAQMFKFSNAAQVVGEVRNQSTSELKEEKIDETYREFSTPELEARYADK